MAICSDGGLVAWGPTLNTDEANLGVVFVGEEGFGRIASRRPAAQEIAV